MKGRTVKKTGKRSDTKATSTIGAAGWILSRTDTRFVAKKIVHEHEDDSTTIRFESDYTLEGLARSVERREREESR
jgi:hypothetical protein